MKQPRPSHSTLALLLTSLLAPACTSDLETASTEQAATTIQLKCGGEGFTVVDRSSTQWPANVIDGGIVDRRVRMKNTPGYSAKLYDTREAAEADLPEVCESFASAIREDLLASLGNSALAACEGALFRAFSCEECDNGAGAKCEQEIRQGSCEWRPGLEPSLSVSPDIVAIAPPVNPDIRVVVSPLPKVDEGPAPGTKYEGDCIVIGLAAARITDNIVGCGEPNSCD